MGQTSPVPRPCACCNILTCQLKEVGKLYFWFPVQHAIAKVTPYLRQAGFEYELMQARPGLSVSCPQGRAKELAENLAVLLTPKELQDTQVLFVRGNIHPQLHDFSDMTSLQRFIKFSQSDWLLEMLAENRLTSYFQPIVHLENTSRIYGYEVLLRGLDQQGKLISPGPILDLATDAGLLPQVDRAARLSAIAQASKHQIKTRIFINFSPTALYDPVSCLRSTVEAIDQAGIPHENIVFEVVESDKPQDLTHLKSILKYYRDAGFVIALDDLGSGYSSLNLLHQLRPDLIKLDMELIRDVHRDFYKSSITEKILEIAQKLNIRTVAEGIECVEELNWLRDRGATFAQGYLIAKPSPLPAESTPHFEAIALPAPSQAPSIATPSIQGSIQQQYDSAQIVSAVTQRIRQSLNLHEILQTTAEEVRQLFAVDRVVIYKFETDWSGVVVVESVAEGWISILGLHCMDTCFQQTHAYEYQQGRIKAIADIHTAGLSECHVEFLERLQIRANLVVPILQQEKLWGLLIAHQCQGPKQWQPSEISLFSQVAAQAAIAIQQSELYQQLRQANQELQRLASSDGLTQVANRRCFDEYLIAEWQQLALKQAPLSLILCDVDCFKLYNDTYGHLAGDDVLIKIASAIAHAAEQPNALVARYGGEEFAVLLPNTHAQEAVAVAQRIQDNVSALQISHESSYVSEHITMSLGIATTLPQGEISPHSLIVLADQGLYRAKAQGRNTLFQVSCEVVLPVVTYPIQPIQISP